MALSDGLIETFAGKLFCPHTASPNAPTFGEGMLNRSFTLVNALFPRTFALSGSKIFFAAKVSRYNLLTNFIFKGRSDEY